MKDKPFNNPDMQYSKNVLLGEIAKVVIEGEVRAYFDSGMFFEVGGLTLGDMMPEDVITLTDSLEVFGTKKVRVTIEVIED